MTMKSFFLTGVLMAASLTFASAKTYNFTLQSATQAGNVKLAAGTYSLKLTGTVAEFTNLGTDKKVMVQVRVNNTGSEKYENTAVDMKTDSATPRITYIELQDTGSKVEF